MRDVFFSAFLDELDKIAKVGAPWEVAKEAIMSALLPKGQRAMRVLREAAQKKPKMRRLRMR